MSWRVAPLSLAYESAVCGDFENKTFVHAASPHLQSEVS